MKLILRQKLWLSFVTLSNLALWIVPSDVIELIARDEHTLLGRYSRPHFTAIVVVLLVSAVSLWIDAAVGERYKRRWFAVIASLLVLVPTLVAADFLLRGVSHEHYVFDTRAYHRPPGFELTADANLVQADLEEGAMGVVFRDRPQAARTYPQASGGYREPEGVQITYRADGRGFRNRTDLAQYDIVAIGDSFAEGSKVSDGDEWPAQLAAMSGIPVYNLGMSGYAPLNYVAALREYGLGLKPKVVVVMLYEGNDFRSAKADAKSTDDGLGARLKRYAKQSPLLGAFDGLLVGVLGPIRADAPLPPSPAIDWMPIAIPASAGLMAELRRQGAFAALQGKVGAEQVAAAAVNYYAFEPKQLIALLASESEFAEHRYWHASRGHLAEMQRLCREAGATLVVAYAPLKAHVVLPIVMDGTPAENLHAFCALRERELPGAEALKAHLRDSIDGMERTVAKWCDAQQIPFVSLTPVLRAGTGAGFQTFFTYDQHWTVEGHSLAAGAIREFLIAKGLLPAVQRVADPPGS